MDVKKMALIAKAGMDANKCCQILIKDATVVPEQLLELQDIAMATQSVLSSEPVMKVVETFPTDEDIGIKQAFILYFEQWKTWIKTQPLTKNC